MYAVIGHDDEWLFCSPIRTGYQPVETTKHAGKCKSPQILLYGTPGDGKTLLHQRMGNCCVGLPHIVCSEGVNLADFGKIQV